MAVSGIAKTVFSVATLYLLCIDKPTPPPTAASKDKRPSTGSEEQRVEKDGRTGNAIQQRNLWLWVSGDLVIQDVLLMEELVAQCAWITSGELAGVARSSAFIINGCKPDKEGSRFSAFFFLLLLLQTRTSDVSTSAEGLATSALHKDKGGVLVLLPALWSMHDHEQARRKKKKDLVWYRVVGLQDLNHVQIESIECLGPVERHHMPAAEWLDKGFCRLKDR